MQGRGLFPPDPPCALEDARDDVPDNIARNSAGRPILPCRDDRRRLFGWQRIADLTECAVRWGQTTGHSIMKKSAMLGLAFLLIGCATQPIKVALDPTIGQDIRVVVAKLGYPNEIREMSGGLMYVWGARSEFTFLMPADSTTTGNIACTIEIAVGADNRIKSYKFDSNHDGCDPYASALSSK
jgi:hypothetical protein